jgi:hypothetical protein
VAGGISQASKINPDFIPTLIHYLDGKVLGDSMHTSHMAPGQGAHQEYDFIGRVLAALNAQADQSGIKAIANSVNGNGKFLSDFIGSSDPTILADVINQASASNFITPLALSLSPTTLADALNAHPQNLGLILNALDLVAQQKGIEAISSLLNNNPNLLPDLLGMLDPKVLTGTTKDEDNLFRHFAIKSNVRARIAGIWLPLPTFIWTVEIKGTAP